MLRSSGTDLNATMPASETSSVNTQASITDDFTRSTTELKAIMFANEILPVTLKIATNNSLTLSDIDLISNVSTKAMLQASLYIQA